MRTRLSPCKEKAPPECITGIKEQLVISGEKRLSTDLRDHGWIQANLRPPNDLPRERAGCPENTFDHQFFVLCQFSSGILHSQACGESHPRWGTVDLPLAKNGHIPEPSSRLRPGRTRSCSNLS